MQIEKEQRRIATLLKRIKLVWNVNSALKFVNIIIINDKSHIAINALMLHSHCIKYGKYQGNESLKDLVLNKCIEAKLNTEDTNALLKAIGAEPIGEL